jgi:hypothetical protein
MEGVGLGATGESAWARFGAYFSAQQREVGLLAYRLCGERAVAEEVTADAFAEAWRRWDELARDEASRPEAMHEIVQRLAQGRLHGAGRPPAPQGAQQPEHELDGVRIRALLSERVTLIPPEDAPTMVIARITEPEGQSAPGESDPRIRRPVVLSTAVTAGTLLLLGAIAMAVSTSGGAAQAKQSPLSLAETGAIGTIVAGPANSAIPASPSPSRSASASPSHSPSASPSKTPSASVSASPTGAANSQSPSTGAAATSATPSSPALSVSASVNHGSNSSWTQLNVTTSVEQPLSALTVTIDVARCAGLSSAGAWDNGSGGQFSETTSQNNDGSITYVFTANSGSEVSTGDITFAAAFSHYHGWTASADTYSVSAQVAASGATQSFSGTF